MNGQKEIQNWLGFEYSILVQSGSAALELALEVLVPEAKCVAIPSVSCWTIAGIIKKKGLKVKFLDQDSIFCIQIPQDINQVDVLVSVEPWGNYNNWQEIERKFKGIKILDSTLSLFGNSNYGKAADYFDAALLSCGAGKPIDIGAGGILLLKNRKDFIQAKKLFFFGREEFSWAQNTNRFVFSDLLHEQLTKQVNRVVNTLPIRANRELWEKITCVNDLPFSIVSLKSEFCGYTTLIPILLNREFPLTYLDVYRVALAENIPLTIQPVSPAYLEMAWLGSKKCQNLIEKFAGRLLFLPAHLEPKYEIIEKLILFFNNLIEQKEVFQYPYDFTLRDSELQDEYLHWVTNGILAKKLSGEFVILDQLMGRLFKLSPAMAETILSYRSKNEVNGKPNIYI